ncbi:MAG: ankyrin repeat domain-containing protein [Spirulina sp. SIO3F2]|nr:ankyrin repeat domain-containing protein [Spirulina sp. SIO3F2]
MMVGKKILDLIQSIENKDAENAKRLINEINNFRQLEYGGSLSPLSLAIDSGQTEVAKMLIASGADVNYSEDHHCSPLTIAIAKDDLEMVQFLLEHGASPNQHYLYHPLEEAMGIGNLEIIEALVNHPEILINEGSYETPPVYMAAAMGNLSVVKLLVDQGARIESSYGELHRYEEYENNQNFQIPNDSEFTYFCDLLYEVESSYSNSQEVDIENSALACAASNGHQDVFDYLYEKTSNARARQYAALILPAGLERRDKIDNSLLQSLFLSAVNNDVVGIRKSIESGIEPNTLNEDGLTALYVATRVAPWPPGNTEAVKLLLESGADPNINLNNVCRSTPLKEAIGSCDIDIVRLLVESGANLEQELPGGWIPIIGAVDAIQMQKEFFAAIGITRNSIELLKILIDAGTNVDAKNKNGYTALDIAQAIGSSSEIIELLINASAATGTE